MRIFSITIATITYLLLNTSELTAQNISLTGNISDLKTGETLTGVVLALDGTPYHAVSDIAGNFSLHAPAGSYTLLVRYTGYIPVSRPVLLSNPVKLVFKLEMAKTQLREVVVKAYDDSKGFTTVNGVQAGTIQLSAAQIKALPSVAGEQDVIKAMQLMPGVKKGVDGGSAMLVRGGNNDQNLFIIDEAVIYNPAHALSLFSVFNTDAIQDTKLIKGPFPAMYQGRLSSVMELRTRQGNTQKQHVEGTISSLSARLSLDGPIVKEKLTYHISARRSYLDQTLKLANLRVPYHFIDINSKISWIIDSKNKITLSSYGGNDVLKADEWNTSDSKNLITSSKTRFTNRASSLQWHASHHKLSQTISLVNSSYNYYVGGAFSGNTVKAQSGLADAGLKGKWNLAMNSKTVIQWGFSAQRHYFRQTQLTTEGELLNNGRSAIPSQTTTEASVYAAATLNLSSKWQVNPGINFSGSGNQHKIYCNPEPRFIISYAPNARLTWKAGYSRMAQYLHMISNSQFALPTDIWYPADRSLKPSTSNQFTLGLFGRKEKWNFSSEIYYKKMYNVCEFAEGKGLQLNIPLPKEISQGTAAAWGGEWMLQTSQKKWSGWLAYTLSWSTRQFDSVNEGRVYYARYDRRHDISMNLSYKLSDKWSVSGIWVYSTGARFTPQTGSYYVVKPGGGGLQPVPIYGATNSAQFIGSHRLDMNLSYKQSKTANHTAEWQIGVYNAYNRAQPYKVSVRTNTDGSYTYLQNGLLGFTPYISYHFSF